MNLRTVFFHVTLAGVTILSMACSNRTEEKPSTRAVETARAVSITQVELRSLAFTTTASGLLVPREEAAVGAEQPNYRVIRVLVEEGARVHAGQPLAALDESVLRSRLAQAVAQAEKAASEAERVHGLDGTGVVSDEDIASRRSQARIAQANLRELQTQAAQLTVRAPVSGIVIERTVRPGSIAGGEPMFRIAREGLIELDAEVPESIIRGIDQGSDVEVTLASGEKISGLVRLVSPTIDPNTKLGRIRIKLPLSTALRVGGFGSALFDQAPQARKVIPEKAIQFESTGPQITVIDEQSRAKRMHVKTGARAGGYVELLQGPPVGTHIALGGGAFLLDGDLVRPVVVSTAGTDISTVPGKRAP